VSDVPLLVDCEIGGAAADVEKRDSDLPLVGTQDAIG
jgi:hypothetical protein